MSAVLIVDDSPADRALFRTILSRGGLTVHEVARGNLALERAREFRPHVIVLDVNLPDTDGHSVCRILRADPFCTGIPILMLTSRGEGEDITAGLEAGADDYLLKDAPAEIILARVRRLVRYRKMAMTTALNEQLAQVGKLMAGIVHEIRGPLSVIRGNAELMRMQLEPTHEAAQWIEPIIRGARILQVRLEHLMAAVRTGPPILTETDLTAVVNEAIDLFVKGNDPRGDKVAIDFEVGEGVRAVEADAGRIIQVLLILLSNAREAALDGQKGARLHIRIEESRRDNREWVKVDISDNGPGIPDSSLDRVFEPFFTTKKGGSGYGLYLAGEIVREHGGHLTACNLSEGGACFTLWLLVHQPRINAIDAADANPSESEDFNA